MAQNCQPKAKKYAQVTKQMAPPSYQETFEDSSNQHKSIQDREQSQMPQMSARDNSTIIVQKRGVAQSLASSKPNARAAFPVSHPRNAPATAATNVVVIQQQPAFVQPVYFHRVPVRTTCPMCSADIFTQLDHEVGLVTWVACCALFLIGGGMLPCCFVAFCCHSFKNVAHKCPKCGYKLGVYERM